MNRSEGTHVSAIRISFYNNVYLLTQVIPPSLEFQQHFKKGMFDKPNTIGFLHVSQYLSIIYDAQLFKQMVKWPIVCKRDEVTYRFEIRNLFSILSRDNPDSNFPPILMSHLIQSGGNRFITIMWKVSQLSLRAYIKREFCAELLHIPCISVMNDLTMMYLNNVTIKRYNNVTDTHREAKSVLDNASNFLNKEVERRNACKSEIFDRRENIKRLVLEISIEPLIQEQLMNVENSDIINVWKNNILKTLQYVREETKKLHELEKYCSYVCKLALQTISSNYETLDADVLPQIDNNNYLLCRQPSFERLIHNLYVNGSIVFSTLLVLVTYVSEQMLCHLNELQDLSRCLLNIQNARKNINSLYILCIALHTKVCQRLRKERYISQRIENICNNFGTGNLFIAARDMFLQSPKINFSFNQYTDYNICGNLNMPPIEGKYKYLFKRFKYNSYPLTELPLITSSDFSDSFQSSYMNGWTSPQAHSSTCEQVSSSGKPASCLYSRLLQRTKLRLKRSREDVLCNSRFSPTPTKRRRSIPEICVSEYSGETRSS